MKKIILLAVVVGMHCAVIAGQDRFVAHEWGTFTSVQGADGVQLEWNPFVPLELPRFVYGQPHRRVDSLLLKSDLIARQRMETPVIYFYSDKERVVDVTVNFPEGRVTEWYPQASRPKDASKAMRWEDVRVLAENQAPLPTEPHGSHYYAARETTANPIRVKNETEKFIFYRGVGSFTAPLRVLVGGSKEDVLHLHNTGNETLRHFYVVQIRDGVGQFQALGDMVANATRQAKLQQGNQYPLSDFQDRISAAVREALVKEGLYEAEAAAMVETWRDSWFGEEGVRVLYILPRTWTDRTLPLSIKPAPDEIARVMVGRAEVIFPSQEWKLLKQIVRYSEAGPEERPGIAEGVKALGMGRFADAAVRRLLGSTPSTDFNANAWALLNAVNGNDTKKLAVR